MMETANGSVHFSENCIESNIASFTTIPNNSIVSFPPIKSIIRGTEVDRAESHYERHILSKEAKLETVPSETSKVNGQPLPPRFESGYEGENDPTVYFHSSNEPTDAEKAFIAEAEKFSGDSRSRPSVVVTDEDTKQSTMILEPTSELLPSGYTAANRKSLDTKIKAWHQVAKECTIFALICGCPFCSLTALYYFCRKTEPGANYKLRLRNYKLSFMLSAIGIVIFVLLITLLLMRNTTDK